MCMIANRRTGVEIPRCLRFPLCGELLSYDISNLGTEKLTGTSAEMMMRTIFMVRSRSVAMIAGVTKAAHSQDALKVAVPQRGSWDAGLPELGKHRRRLQKARARP